MMRFSFLLILASSPLAVTAQSSVPVANEPRHHVQLANDRVRVFDVVVPPGDTTLYHVHAVDYVYVTFGPASLVAQALGSDPTPLVLHDAEVRFTRGPITHRVSNPSATPFHNLTIELPGRGDSTSAMPPLAAGDSIVLENDRVRVTRHVIARGATRDLGQANRSLDVYLSSGSLQGNWTGDGPQPKALQPAAFWWHGAGEPHTMRNIGRAPVVLLTILVK